MKTWLCEVCLATAKTETMKLIDMLIQDFRFSEKEVHVFFSGHRGYHVHVESKAIENLDAIARKEIVDYVCGLGFDVAFHGLSQKTWRMPHNLRGLNPNDSGWRGRVAKGVYNFILNANQEDYESIGLRKNVIEAINKNRDTIFKSWNNTGPWNAVKGLGFKNWKKIIDFCANVQSAKVDTVVTTDTHRLIRLANTLNGKTSLKKVEFPISDIEHFDPLRSAVAFNRGTVTVFVSDVPKFRLHDEIFGPYKNQKAELPTAAAMLLTCKGRAEVVE